MPDTTTSNLRMQQKLDIAIEKVKKIDTPLLVIGLGGTGADMVRTIKSLFAQRYVLPKDANGADIPVPEHTAYLAIDSDNGAKEGLDHSEFVSIAIPNLKSILDPARREFLLQPYERVWVNRNLDSDSAGIGAGTYRQAARFMLSRNYLKVREAMLGALKGIVSVNVGATAQLGRVEVVICAGISGGTGSGTFLDVPQIVRHLFATDPMLVGKQYSITGYLVLPDISTAVANSSSEEVLKRNAYAALKELDFWMQAGTHKTPYAAQYDATTKIAWTQAPYDHCALLSGTNVQGAAFANPNLVAYRTVAENLLHYLAMEKKDVNDDGSIAQYSYISYEDNLKAILAGLAGDRSKPLYYGYRAVGAFTKRIPKQEVLFYEGKLLFGTFLPARDDMGHLVPSDALLKDGKVKDRAARIFGSPQQLYQSFAGNNAPLPQACSTAPNDKGRVAALASMNPAPHDRWSSWREQVAAPAVNKAAEQYLNGAWDRFQKMAKEIMTDPAIGPFGLLRFLQDPTGGLLVQTDAQAQGWEGVATNFQREVRGKYELCQRAWPTFVKPPMLGAGKAIEAYLQALTSFYDHVRKTQFMAEMARQAKKLSQRIREWTEQALVPLCRDVEALDARFGEKEAADAKLMSDVYDLSAVSGRLDAEFQAGNADGKVSRDFLGLLCDASFETVKNVDPHATGVTFTYRSKGMDQALTAIRESLKTIFGGINQESLDAIMLQQAGDQVDAQNSWMDALAQSVLTSAMPLFAQGTEQTDRIARYSYLSVPDNAPMHMARFKETLSREEVQPKNSALRDHLYCLTAWDGLPLFRYSQLANLQDAYHRAFADEKMPMGLHLVWDGNPDSQYQTNWTRLPEPAPYYLFRSHGPVREENRHAEADGIVARGIASGMIEVDDSGETVALRIRRLYVDSMRQTLKTSELLHQEADAIRAAKDPVTGDPIPAGTQLERLQAFAAGADITTLSSSVSPACLAAAFGMTDRPLNPFDQATRANPAQLAEAKKNHRFLCEKMATALIEQRPQLLQDIAAQVEGFEYVHGLIREIGGKLNVWDRRKAYADDAALMFCYGLLLPGMQGYQYLTRGGKRVSVVNPVLLAEDLKAEKQPILQLTAYLADVDAENPARQDLEDFLREARDAIQKALEDSALTEDQVKPVVAQCEKTAERLDKEISKVDDRLHERGADRQWLNGAMATLTAMKAAAQAEAEKLTGVLEML